MEMIKVVTTSAGIYEPDHQDGWIELTGEFDVRDLETLRRTLDGVPGSPVCVDLSGVTFLDLLCARELADRSRDGRLALREASWQAGHSFEACGFGDPAGGGEDAARNRGMCEVGLATGPSAEEERGG